MTVVKVEPSQVFSITDFPEAHERFNADQPHVWDPTLYKPIVYKCTSCGFEIEFSEKDFEKHAHSDFSNLLPDDKKLIDDYLKKNGLIELPFLDFYCPKCNKPISISFKYSYGGKHGEYFTSIKFILEIV